MIGTVSHMQVGSTGRQPAGFRIKVERAVEAAFFVYHLWQGYDKGIQQSLNRLGLQQSVNADASLLSIFVCSKKVIAIATALLDSRKRTPI